MRSKKIWLWAGIAWSVFGCAPEKSDEIRKRDQAIRDQDRLKKASGYHAGYLSLPGGGVTPIALDVKVENNPTPDGLKPALSVVLQTGLFGGIRVQARTASFDWGTGQLSASFDGPSGGKAEAASGPVAGPAAFELVGKIENGVLREAIVQGRHLGTQKMEVDTTARSWFDAADLNHFQVAWGDGVGSESSAVLTLRLRATPQPGPNTSDLPFFPGLEGAMVFSPFARVPQTARAVFYDPWQGTVDVQFTDSAWLRLPGFRLDARKKELPVGFQGLVTVGGAMVRGVRLQPLADAPRTADLPPMTYLGKFQGSPKTRAFKAIVRLDYDGSVGIQQPSLPFPTAPVLRFEFIVCNGDEPFSKSTLRLDSLDYLNKKVIFKRGSGTGMSTLEILYDSTWSHLDGSFLLGDSTSGQDRPRLVLDANAGVSAKGCAAREVAE